MTKRPVLCLAVCLSLISVPFTAEKGVIIRVTPAFGAHPEVVEVRTTRAERNVIGLMTRSIDTYRGTIASSLLAPRTATSVVWKVESSASSSRTLQLSRQVLAQVQFLFESLGLIRADRTYVVVGRTQQFINDTLEGLDCFPNLVRTGGVHLMGATVCNRRVIVLNLTGYFFLRRAGDVLTTALESRAEPNLGRVDYRIADRNISGLAHEWVHVARASANDGQVAPDEPAWVREGFAELMAGVARVLTFPSRMNYSVFHVVRIRKFTDWEGLCPEPLRRYREDADLLAGCEYYLGAVAMEYLVATKGGLPKAIELFRRSAELLSFSKAFRETYGESFDSFEQRADAYARAIAALPDN